MSHLAHSPLACILTVCVSVAGLSGCQPDAQTKTLHVFAASSLTEAFSALEAGFEEAHEEFDVSLNLAGSQTLRLQIEHGARAHAVASANTEHIHALERQGHLVRHDVFAHNELVLVVPQHNPAQIEHFKDLVKAKRWVMGTESVPIGRYARAVLKKAGDEFEATVTQSVVSFENNVRLIRTKVLLGEADAALVYRTDTRSVSGLKVVEIPKEYLGVVAYSMGVTSIGANHPAIEKWTRYVASPAGQEILKQHGFGAP